MRNLFILFSILTLNVHAENIEHDYDFAITEEIIESPDVHYGFEFFGLKTKSDYHQRHGDLWPLQRTDKRKAVVVYKSTFLIDIPIDRFTADVFLNFEALQNAQPTKNYQLVSAGPPMHVTSEVPTPFFTVKSSIKTSFYDHEMPKELLDQINFTVDISGLKQRFVQQEVGEFNHLFQEIKIYTHFLERPNGQTLITTFGYATLRSRNFILNMILEGQLKSEIKMYRDGYYRIMP